MYTSLGAMMLQIDIELVECVFCKYTIVVISALHQLFFKIKFRANAKRPLGIWVNCKMAFNAINFVLLPLKFRNCTS